MDQIGDKPIDKNDGAYVGSIRINVFENTFDIATTESLTFEDLYAILYASLTYMEGVATDMEHVAKIGKDKLH